MSLVIYQVLVSGGHVYTNRRSNVCSLSEKPREQWFSTVLTLKPFYSVPHVMVTST